MAAPYLEDIETVSSDVFSQLRSTRETVKNSYDGLANVTLRLYSMPRGARFRRNDVEDYRVARMEEKSKYSSLK